MTVRASMPNYDKAVLAHDYKQAMGIAEALVKKAKSDLRRWQLRFERARGLHYDKIVGPALGAKSGDLAKKSN